MKMMDLWNLEIKNYFPDVFIAREYYSPNEIQLWIDSRLAACCHGEIRIYLDENKIFIRRLTTNFELEDPKCFEKVASEIYKHFRVCLTTTMNKHLIEVREHQKDVDDCKSLIDLLDASAKVDREELKEKQMT